MKKEISEKGQEQYVGVTAESEFSSELFHKPEYQFEDDEQWAFHSNMGSITVLDRMTGFGWRDIETGYRDTDGEFWLATGNVDVREAYCNTVGDAIQYIKGIANTCKGNEGC